MIARGLAAALVRPLTVGVAVTDDGASRERRDAIVVLGAPLVDDRVGPVLVERLAVARALWRGGAAPQVIVTGGRTRGAGRSEAAAMAEALIADGVPATAIVVEDQALTTADNARRVRALAPDVRDVWLATQRFHTRRAVRCFARVGFDARAAYWRDGLEDDPARALRWSTREYAAWLRALVR